MENRQIISGYPRGDTWLVLPVVVRYFCQPLPVKLLVSVNLMYFLTIASRLSAVLERLDASAHYTAP